MCGCLTLTATLPSSLFTHGVCSGGVSWYLQQQQEQG